LCNHTLRIGAQLGTAASDQPSTAAAAVITVSVDSTFLRSREEGERHLEVRVGNGETASGGRQVFGAVAKADTDITTLIRQSLRAVGRTDDTEGIAFTDGGPGPPSYPCRCRYHDAILPRLVPHRNADLGPVLN
jgi:hypothetical protein